MKVILCKRIDGGMEHEDIFLEKEYDLPFCPPVNMVFIDGSLDETVVDVLYDHKREAIEAWTHPDNVMISDSPADHPNTRVEVWLADGYKVVEDYGGQDSVSEPSAGAGVQPDLECCSD